AENDLKVNTLTTQSAAKKTELDEARKFLAEIGDIQRVQEQMAMVRSQVEKAQIEVASIQDTIDKTKLQVERLNGIASELSALKKDQEEGRIRPPFSSSVKRAYNQWGFVVIEGGNDQGVVKRAQLDVNRRGQPICKLIVTSVEPQETIAEVIPGSMVPGQTIQEGDTVTKSEAPIPQPGDMPAPAAAPAGGVPAADPGMLPQAPGASAPAENPFGDPGMQGGGAPAPAAPSNDPFGAPPAGGAAPAPAPAPAAPGNDPFGAPPAGGAAPAPAPPAANDPFGAPPAGGATPPAPAPPANDPFATPPAAPQQ
ncbi:MAG: hypothetical protein KDM63_04360, partial [Verrucomicrobiae bacterium]|nr:hypothetical protein [Verrucomicrobiae bacterium]